MRVAPAPLFLARTVSLFGPALRHLSPVPSFGAGFVLGLFYFVLASIVVLCTYTLQSIANVWTPFGLLSHELDSPAWSVPVHTLLRGQTTMSTFDLPQNQTLSFSALVYARCGFKDRVCADAYMPLTIAVWSILGAAFVDLWSTPRPHLVRIDHINNLSGWNKALAQFSVADDAIVCILRRANYTYLGTNASSVDSLAFCAIRPRDPNWVCENSGPMNSSTRLYSMNHGHVTFLGQVARSDIILNAGHSALLTGGNDGPVHLSTVPSVDEFQGGVLQHTAPFDLFAVSDCSLYDMTSQLGWRLTLSGNMTLFWTCNSLMLTNAVILWCMLFYCSLLQWLYLRHSVICVAPVYMSKSVLGLALVGMTVYGNDNIQVVTTFLVQNAIAPTLWPRLLALCGPMQAASVAGIVTGKFVQLWFTPRIVTQTWLLGAFSVLNWALIFVLERFVFPYQQDPLAATCTLPMSTNCFRYSRIAHTWYLSAVVASGVIGLAIGVIYLDMRSRLDEVRVHPDNSLLTYLEIVDLRAIAKTCRGCVTRDGRHVIVDSGILLMKNMLRVSNLYITRVNNVPYTLAHALLPHWIQRWRTNDSQTIRVLEMKDGRITRTSYYLPRSQLYKDQSPWAPGCR
ncbi:hypothetical protein SDRG_16409 [Saprolegnia diclina VS20]|uniref:Transmembrane protein n=1 Tax=Saprolegnia diclina (strain VS20) TaxID=1156394 RepID=T0R172_SAPDV|nr:hypothetical protein SDRG_16409 [Saprolegnia diclina VS20]EQC25748.1 hypothetical protein SDRG_16409 [Saprolegnia diclina VS20]|eukprot:XP_008620840.1 hypothetical protein SDRG_16409 [Saprolegnia diclina VS20]